MSFLPRWVKDELQTFLKLFIPSVKFFRNGIESQKGHGEINVRARAN